MGACVSTPGWTANLGGRALAEREGSERTILGDPHPATFTSTQEDDRGVAAFAAGVGVGKSQMSRVFDALESGYARAVFFDMPPPLALLNLEGESLRLR